MRRVHIITPRRGPSCLPLAPTQPSYAADAKTAAKADADNTAKNARDRRTTLRAARSGRSEADRDHRTQQIYLQRRSIGKDRLSTNAKNVKIITQDGVVTLRGSGESLGREGDDRERRAEDRRREARRQPARDRIAIASHHPDTARINHMSNKAVFLHRQDRRPGAADRRRSEGARASETTTSRCSVPDKTGTRDFAHEQPPRRPKAPPPARAPAACSAVLSAGSRGIGSLAIPASAVHRGRSDHGRARRAAVGAPSAA